MLRNLSLTRRSVLLLANNGRPYVLSIRSKASAPAAAAAVAESPVPTLATKSNGGERNEQALSREEVKAARQKEKSEERNENLSSALFESLSPTLQKNLSAMGVTTLFPVQAQTLEACREGKDMVVRSKTGSGKTIAFALPTVEKLLSTKPSGKTRSTPRAIVLAPTRELALQVHREFEKLAPTLNCVAVYGGAPISTQAQQLGQVVDVVVGTPGRVKDFLDRGSLKLDQIKVAILDEADEMLKVGFYEAIQEIYSSMPDKADRQNLLFSATVSPEIRQICESFLNKPTFVDLVGKDASKIPDTVEMCVTPVTYETKPLALSAILAQHASTSTKENPRRALVFCTTKRECEDLSRSFTAADSTITGGALHGDMTQSVREAMLQKFRDGTCLVLVATDVAARGLDIPEVDLVIHYSLPRDQDSFVHRSGRTGRAGRKGTNVILCEMRSESRDLKSLERFAGKPFRRRAVPCGPEVIRQQGENIAAKLAQSGLLLEWLRPVADALRAKDAEKGTDSLAAALALAMGGSDKVKVFSALNGRSGNQTIIINKGDEKLDEETVSEFLRTLPTFQKHPKGTVVRDFHRVKGSSTVLVDIPDYLVNDVTTHGKSAGFDIEIADGVLPDSYQDFGDAFRSSRGGSGGYSSSSNRNSFRSSSGGGYGGRSSGGYGHQSDRSSRRRDDYSSSNSNRRSSSFGSSRSGGSNRRRNNDY